MKVAYLLGSLNRGGAETLVLDCFHNSMKASFSLLGIYRRNGVLSEQFLSTSVKMKHLPVKRFGFLNYIYQLRSLLLSEQVDIVHAHQPLDAIYAILATTGTKIKIVQTLHGYDFAVKGLNKFIYWISIKKVYNVFVSESQKKYYVSKYNLEARKQSVIYNGVNFSKLDSTRNNIIRQELGISSNSLLLAMVGSFVDGRDQITICRFLKLLDKKGVDFHFLFIGKKNEVEAWRYDNCVEFCRQNNLNNKVSFLGLRNDIPSILKELDAFVYATDHDTFGIAVIEAIAAGVPVFVNDWEVMTEITQSGSYATLYLTRDINDLMSKFEVFLTPPNDYKLKTQSAAKLVKSIYSIDNHIIKLQQVYNNIHTN